MGVIDARLAELGLALPEPPAPVASYVPFVKTGSMVFVSGQVSMGDKGVIKGRLGAGFDLSAGKYAARWCGLNLLAQLKVACAGDLDRVRRVVKLGGFVAVERGFPQIPQVINGCSDLMQEVFGDDIGRHARAAVGVAELPLGAAVEVDGVFEIGD